MATRTRYLVDANVLMQAKRLYYRFAVCPGFWDCIAWHHKQGSILSIDRVKKEIDDGKDDLSQWVKSKCPKTFFEASTDSAIAAEYGNAMVWVQSQSRYTPAAKSKFATDADGWLIAYAKHHGVTVVTQEVPAPDSRKEAKIPDVCDALGVKYVDTFDMLEKLKVQFNWKPTP
ncbi:MAG: DUF4411 family protein [Burkholderiales bacterium]|nr:DUF4411 family protein [Burkholderiales bacterium]